MVKFKCFFRQKTDESGKIKSLQAKLADRQKAVKKWKKHAKTLTDRQPYYRQNLAFNRILSFAVYCHDHASELSADVVIAHGVQSLMAGHAVSEYHGCQFFCDVIETPSFNQRNAPMRWHSQVIQAVDDMSHLYLPKCNQLFTVSNTLADRLRTYVQTVDTLPNYRYSETFVISNQLREIIGVSADDIILLVSGRIVNSLSNVISALKQLPDNFHLVMLGKIQPLEYKAFVLSLADQKGVASRCHWLDPVPYDKLLPLISGADIGLIVLDKTRENTRVSLPNRVFDYLAAQLPIISPDIPDIAHIINQYQCGYILNDESVESWVNAIQRACHLKVTLIERVKIAAEQLNWLVSEQVLLSAIGKANSVTFLSLKDLSLNQRTQRMIKSLKAYNKQIKVCCLSHGVLQNEVQRMDQVEYHFLKWF